MSGLRRGRWAALALVAALVLALASGCGDDDAGTASTTSEASDTTAASPGELEGKPWVLTSGLSVAGWEAVAPSATFENGTVSGSNGCNRYRGNYTLDGGSIKIAPSAATSIACGPPGADVETTYMEALASVTSWSVDGDQLTLGDDSGDVVLRFGPPTPVGVWTATSIQTGDAIVSPPIGVVVSARFADDGSLTGSAGCNTYTTTYTLSDGGGIAIPEPASTRKLCPEPEGVMDTEAAYLKVLPTAASYTIDAGKLTLLAADGTIVAVYATTGP